MTESKLGRPSKYTKELCEEICIRLAEGESLRKICKDEHIPSKSTVLSWLFKDEYKDFQDQYARAREVQAEGWADDIIEIADNGENDWTTKTNKKGEEYDVVDYDVIQRSKLRVDTRKWIMVRLLPKKYGDKIQTEHSGSIEIPAINFKQWEKKDA